MKFVQFQFDIFILASEKFRSVATCEMDLKVFANAREDFEVNVRASSILLDPFHKDNGKEAG